MYQYIIAAMIHVRHIPLERYFGTWFSFAVWWDRGSSPFFPIQPTKHLPASTKIQWDCPPHSEQPGRPLSRQHRRRQKSNVDVNHRGKPKARWKKWEPRFGGSCRCCRRRCCSWCCCELLLYMSYCRCCCRWVVVPLAWRWVWLKTTF